MKSIILFGHGARSADWARPMEVLAATVKERAPDTAVRLAFLEFMAPTLPDCIAGLLADGVGKIVVMPMFIARGGHLKRDVPETLAALRLAHPQVEFVLGDAIGEHALVVEAMAAAALLEAGL